jgi:glycerophosphoryl diester phosphodiesterase
MDELPIVYCLKKITVEMNKNICFFCIFFILLISCRQEKPLTSKNNDHAVITKTISDLKSDLVNFNAEKVLVVAHRGDWRNAPENSLQAIENCIEMGVDMVEIDVRMTRDSQLVVIHDATLDRTTTGKGKVADWTLDSLKTLFLRNGANHPTHHHIPTLEEAMLTAKGKILVNLDKCYNYFDKAYQILEKTGTTDHVVMKGKVPMEQVKTEFGEYLSKVPFMPIVDLHNPDAEKIIAEYQRELKPVAFEVLFKDESPALLNDFHQIRKNDSRVWVNTLWESLNAGYEDDMAVDNPDKVYGWLIDKGVNMIQTDRPELLLEYLRTKNLHE